MSERVTIMLDSQISSRLHRIQAEEIRTTQKAVSFSRVLNQTLAKGLNKK